LALSDHETPNGQALSGRRWAKWMFARGFTPGRSSGLFDGW
jgi:hypothetical protein